ALRRLVGEGAQVLPEPFGLLTLVRVRLDVASDLARVSDELGVARHRAEGCDVNTIERLALFDELSEHVDRVCFDEFGPVARRGRERERRLGLRVRLGLRDGVEVCRVVEAVDEAQASRSDGTREERLVVGATFGRQSVVMYDEVRGRN